MAVMLYHKDGKSTKAGPDEFRSYINSGHWFLTVEESKHDIEIPEEIEPLENTDGEVRAMAKKKGIKHWHNKNIEKLKKEVEEWQPEN